MAACRHHFPEGPRLPTWSNVIQHDPTCPSSVHLALHFKCVKLCHESKPCMLESCCKHEDIKVEISLSHWCVSRHNADSTRVSLISIAACRSWLPWTLEKAGAKWCWINRLVFLKLPLRQHEDSSTLIPCSDAFWLVWTHGTGWHRSMFAKCKMPRQKCLKKGGIPMYTAYTSK